MKIPEYVVDGFWGTLFCVLVIVFGPGFMLLGALATSLVVGNPNNGSYHGFAATVEFVFLFGGLSIGLFLASKLIQLLTRRFIDRPTYDRWQTKFMESLSGVPAPLRALMMFLNRLTAP